MIKGRPVATFVLVYRGRGRFGLVVRLEPPPKAKGQPDVTTFFQDHARGALESLRSAVATFIASGLLEAFVEEADLADRDLN